MSDTPVLWHLEVSHFNEKARWALDYKGVPHMRRSIPAGLHARKAKKLAGGKTFPVLELDGRAIGDSAQILVALEERYPDPCLFPSDPEQRARALELEERFGEIAHQLRRTLFFDWLRHRDVFLGFFRLKGTPVERMTKVAWPVISRQVARQYDVTEESARRGEQEIERAFDLIEAETAQTGYLVGDSFTLADLTAAAVLSPVVVPPGQQYPPFVGPEQWPERTRSMRARFSKRPGFEWVFRMFAEHRPASAAVSG